MLQYTRRKVPQCECIRAVPFWIAVYMCVPCQAYINEMNRHNNGEEKIEEGGNAYSTCRQGNVVSSSQYVQGEERDRNRKRNRNRNRKRKTVNATI